MGDKFAESLDFIITSSGSEKKSNKENPGLPLFSGGGLSITAFCGRLTNSSVTFPTVFNGRGQKPHPG